MSLTADQLHEQIQELLREYATTTQAALRNELSWTKNLKNNIDVVVNNGTLSLEAPEYSIFVEYGRSPGKQPPLNVIYSWCQSKNIPTSAAYPIAKKIGEEGLPAHPFMYIFEENVENLDSAIGDLIQDAIINDVENN